MNEINHHLQKGVLKIHQETCPDDLLPVQNRQSHIDQRMEKLFKDNFNEDDYFSHLPHELLIKVFDFLEPADMKEVVSVSIYFGRIGQDLELVKSKGMYSKRLEKALKKDPRVWKIPEFKEKYETKLQDVISLDLSSIPCSSELLIFIQDNCPKIQHIAHIALEKNITDDLLTSIPTSVTSLNLRFCRQITDAGLVHLSPLKNLTSLDLSLCDRITDAGLEHLSPRVKIVR